MRESYPPLDPYEHGYLPASDGNRVYWEACGNPEGKPALVLHGGPGSGCRPGMRQYFDPAAYRIVLFDQRNCGRSTPHASDPAVSLAANTTPHLISDIEALRTQLGIDRWLVYGTSWGSVLALAYAQQHTDRVSEMILTGVATGRQCEVDLLTRGLGLLLPGRLRALPRRGARDRARRQPRRGLQPPAGQPRRGRPRRCGQQLVRLEDAMLPGSPPSARYQDPRFRFAFARLVTHYWSNGHFLGDDGVLLAQAGRLARVPGIVIEGTLDLGNLLGTPWLLTAAWPGSELRLVDNAGHDGSAPMTAAIVAATDQFAHAHGNARA